MWRLRLCVPIHCTCTTKQSKAVQQKTATKTCVTVVMNQVYRADTAVPSVGAEGTDIFSGYTN